MEDVTTHKASHVLASFLSIAWLGIGQAHGQSVVVDDQPDTAATVQTSARLADNDARLRLAEPDYRLINLPTTLRLPLHRSNFALTHRFNANLARGTFGEHASNLFGLDEGAAIGLEYRFAVARHVEAAVYRASFDKTFQFYGKYDAVYQNDSTPLSVAALVSIEGPNNFKERRAPSLGAVLSRSIDNKLAVYATPTWVHNSAAAAGIARDTLFLGIGGRLRVLSTVYVVAETAPRLAGYRPGEPAFGFAIEKRAGRHLFQLNLANTQGSTFAQTARGGFPNSLHLGFNLARKFF